MTADITRTVTAYFTDRLGVDPTMFDNETLLISSGIVDSIEIVNLIIYLEAEFSIKIDPMGVSIDNLDSINAIVNLIKEES